MLSPDDLLAAHVATIPAYRAWIRDMRTARQKLLAQGRSRDEPASKQPALPSAAARVPTAPLVDPALEAVIAAALVEETPVTAPEAGPPDGPLVGTEEGSMPTTSAAGIPETPVAPPEAEESLPDDPAARLKARFQGLGSPATPAPATPPAAPAPDKPLNAATLRGIYGDKQG